MKNEIIIQKNNVKRSYLRVTKISRIYGITIAVLLLAGILIWLFAMPFMVSISGFCYPTQTFVRFFYPVYMDNYLNVGDDIRVGNAKGQITFFDDEYISADTLDDSTDVISIAFMNSEYYDPNETYRSGMAQFNTEIVGNYEYNVMQTEITIGGLIHDWAKEAFGREE